MPQAIGGIRRVQFRRPVVPYQSPDSGIWEKTRAIRLSVLAIFTAAIVSAHPKISKELTSTDPDSTVDVIVQFKTAPTSESHRKVTSRGGLLKSGLDLVRGGAYRISMRQLESLANDPDVEQIVPDRQLSAVVYNQSFVNKGTPSFDSSTADAYGHGTHVAGIIASSGTNSNNGQYAFQF